MAGSWRLPLFIALLSALFGFAVQFALTGSQEDGAASGASHATERSVVGEPRPDIHLPDASGSPRRLSEWDGRVLVVNFWATWCPPCREEMPVLVSAARDYEAEGVSVIGVAFDQAAKVKAFMLEFDVVFPVLVEEGVGAALSAAYGNPQGLLPYTVVIDRTGTIRHTHRGRVDRQTLDGYLAGLL